MGFDGFLQAVVDLATVDGGGVTADDDIDAMGQWPRGQRLEGLAPHDDGMVCGESLEALQVFGEVPQQLVVVAYGTVGSNGGDDADVVVAGRDAL